MITHLEVQARQLQGGAGLYDAGNTGRCYTKLFITDTGRVLPVNHRSITEEDLLTVYNWGMEDQKILSGKSTEETDGEGDENYCQTEDYSDGK